MDQSLVEEPPTMNVPDMSEEQPDPNIKPRFSRGQKIAIGVGIVIGLIVLSLIIYMIMTSDSTTTSTVVTPPVVDQNQPVVDQNQPVKVGKQPKEGKQQKEGKQPKADRPATQNVTPLSYNYLKNKNSNLYLGTRGNASTGKNDALQWDKVFEEGQQWVLDPSDGTLKNKWGQCLGSSNAGANGKVSVMGCNSSDNQKWNRVGKTIRNSSGKCLGILESSTNKGEVAVQWNCNSNPDQEWDLE
jgi:flagellar basal body-associated protein FliL